MAKYLLHGTYTTDGYRGLLKEGGTSRRAHATKLVENVGGRVEAFYYAFGGEDLYILVDVPDNVSAAALSWRSARAARSASASSCSSRPRRWTRRRSRRRRSATARPASSARVDLPEVRRAARRGEHVARVRRVLRRGVPRRQGRAGARRVEQVGDVFVHHLRLVDDADFDDELRGWLRAARVEYGDRMRLAAKRRAPRT